MKSPKAKRFIERFNKTVLDDFFRIAFRKTATRAWRHSKRTWSSGWFTKTPSALIEVTGTEKNVP